MYLVKMDLPSTSRYAVDSTSLDTKRISPASSALTLHISRKCLVPEGEQQTSRIDLYSSCYGNL